MMTKTTTITMPNSNRTLKITPCLEELTTNPKEFSISLQDAEKELGTYVFNKAIIMPTKLIYKASKIDSKQQNAKVPRDLINGANYILNKIAKQQKKQKPNFELTHNCNFYILKTDAINNSNIHKYGTIINIYKQNDYKFKNEAEATKTY